MLELPPERLSPIQDAASSLQAWSQCGESDRNEREQIVRTILDAANESSLVLSEHAASLVESLPCAAMAALAREVDASRCPWTTIKLPNALSRLPGWLTSSSRLKKLDIGFLSSGMELDLREFVALKQVRLDFSRCVARAPGRFVVHLACMYEIVDPACRVELCVVRYGNDDVIEEINFPYRSTGCAVNLNGSRHPESETAIVCRMWSSGYLLDRARHRLEHPDIPWQFPVDDGGEEAMSRIAPVLAADEVCCVDLLCLAHADQAWAVESDRWGEFLAAQMQDMISRGDTERYMAVMSSWHMSAFVLSRDRGPEAGFQLCYYDPEATLDEFNLSIRTTEQARRLTLDNHVDGNDDALPVSAAFFDFGDALGEEHMAVVAVYTSARSVVDRLLSTRSPRDPSPLRLDFLPLSAQADALVGSWSILRNELGYMESLRLMAEFDAPSARSLVPACGAAIAFQVGLPDMAGHLIELSARLSNSCAPSNDGFMAMPAMLPFGDRTCYEAALRRGASSARVMVSVLVDLVRRRVLTPDEVTQACLGTAKRMPHCEWLRSEDVDAFTAHVDAVIVLARAGAVEKRHVVDLVQVHRIDRLSVRMLTVYVDQVYRLVGAGLLRLEEAQQLCKDVLNHKVGRDASMPAHVAAFEQSSAWLVCAAKCDWAGSPDVDAELHELMAARLDDGRRQYLEAMVCGHGEALVSWAIALACLFERACLPAEQLRSYLPYRDDDGLPIYLNAHRRGDLRTVIDHARSVALLRKAGVIPLQEAATYAVRVSRLQGEQMETV